MQKAALLFTWLVILIMGGDHLFAAEDVVIRVSARPESAWLGEKVVIELDVLGKDGWAQLKKGTAGDLSGGYLHRYETQGTRLQESINGDSYSGQRYEYLFFPQRAGEMTLNPASVEVELKYWGAEDDNKRVAASTPPVTLEVKDVPGVPAGQPVVSTTRLTAVQQWNTESSELTAGDSVSRSIRIEAADVSGMVLPPLKEVNIAGVAVYPASPRVEDMYARGDLSGQRIEEFVYVPEQPGEFTASELSFSWWNSKAEKLETIRLEGKSFSVKAAPGSAAKVATAGTVEDEIDGKNLIWTGIAAGLVVLVALFAAKPMARGYQYWQNKRRHSEKAYFKQVSRAARNKDGMAMVKSSMAWLDRISATDVSPRMDLFLARYGGSTALTHYRNFNSSLLSSGNSSAINTYYSVLAESRSRWLKSQRTKQRTDDILPSLGIES